MIKCDDYDSGKSNMNRDRKCALNVDVIFEEILFYIWVARLHSTIPLKSREFRTPNTTESWRFILAVRISIEVLVLSMKFTLFCISDSKILCNLFSVKKIW